MKFSYEDRKEMHKYGVKITKLINKRKPKSSAFNMNLLTDLLLACIRTCVLKEYWNQEIDRLCLFLKEGLNRNETKPS